MYSIHHMNFTCPILIKYMDPHGAIPKFMVGNAIYIYIYIYIYSIDGVNVVYSIDGVNVVNQTMSFKAGAVRSLFHVHRFTLIYKFTLKHCILSGSFCMSATKLLILLVIQKRDQQRINLNFTF